MSQKIKPSKIVIQSSAPKKPAGQMDDENESEELAKLVIDEKNSLDVNISFEGHDRATEDDSLFDELGKY